MENNIKPVITLSLDDLKGICALAHHGLQIVRGQQIVADAGESAKRREEWQREIKISTDMIAEYDRFEYLSADASELIRMLAD